MSFQALMLPAHRSCAPAGMSTHPLSSPTVLLNPSLKEAKSAAYGSFGRKAAQPLLSQERAVRPSLLQAFGCEMEGSIIVREKKNRGKGLNTNTREESASLLFPLSIKSYAFTAAAHQKKKKALRVMHEEC